LTKTTVIYSAIDFEAALTIIFELRQSATGYSIYMAINQANAERWPRPSPNRMFEVATRTFSRSLTVFGYHDARRWSCRYIALAGRGGARSRTKRRSYP
jgi:hypothetical protein